MDQERMYRDALGQFPTGVAIVTTRDEGQRDIGLTINSFTSVSLSPKIVTWSLAASSNNFYAFSRAKHFAIHVLGEHQEDISTKFSKKIPHKFEGVEQEDSGYNIPLLADFICRFVCRRISSIYLGDHIIFAGLVERFEVQKHEPLVFLRGKYTRFSIQSSYSSTKCS